MRASGVSPGGLSRWLCTSQILMRSFDAVGLERYEFARASAQEQTGSQTLEKRAAVQHLSAPSALSSDAV